MEKKKFKKCPRCYSTNIAQTKEWFNCKDCRHIEKKTLERRGS